MTEAELTAEVHQLCDLFGLWIYERANPLVDQRGRGWPDLVIVGTKVLFRELKSATGMLSADQGEVGWLLKNAGADWAVWWPHDLNNGNIRRQLEAIAR